MAVGQGVNILSDSYVAVGRETTLGTLVTATANLDFLSAGLKTSQESKTLEQVERKRTMTKSLRLGKKIEGEVEAYMYPLITACAWIMQNAFGGTITTATATGETAGGSAFTHTFNIGNMDQSFPSLSIKVRKGPTGTGQVFDYAGIRVNEFGLTAELDDAVKFNIGLIGIDSTSGGSDVESSFTVSSALPLSFENARFSIENSFASLTSTSFWHVQSVEFSLNNNLKADNESRRIGSDLLTVLPPGAASFTLNTTMRFDTLTAYNAMLNDTTLYGELEFLGNTISTSIIREGLKLQFAKLKVNDAGDPEVSGPDGILTAEVSFQVLRDDSSAAGYAVRALLTNNMSAI